ncbi:MAG: MerR family transcriptional regulator [Acidibacillus sp.]|nr:MerR family transcriptional regulator [Acidibacillus sp.]
MDRTYTIADISQEFEVSHKTIRNWENTLGGYIQVRRGEHDLRIYSQEAYRRLRQVWMLREKGIAMSTIREIFAILYTEDEVAANLESNQMALIQVGAESPTASERTLSPSAQLVVAGFLKEMTSRHDVVLREHIDELKGFLKQQFEDVKVVQGEILEALGPRREKHKRKRWFWRTN